MTALLSVTDVHAGYLPGVDILRGLSSRGRAEEITLVIGPNGAGKSTLLRTMFAFLGATRAPSGCRAVHREAAPGQVKAPASAMCRRRSTPFPRSPWRKICAWARGCSAATARGCAPPRAHLPDISSARREAALAAGELSGGQGRMLSVAREMMTQPRLMLVDEPTAGIRAEPGRSGLRMLETAQADDRRHDPAGRPERGARGAARRSGLYDQSRADQGARAGPGLHSARVRALIQECLLG